MFGSLARGESRRGSDTDLLVTSQPEVHLAPDKLVKYSYVAMVLAEAQRLGVVKIGLIGSERFME